MCGFILTNISKDIKDHSKILKHRGPDDTGFFKDNNIKIIFNRL